MQSYTHMLRASRLHTKQGYAEFLQAAWLSSAYGYSDGTTFKGVMRLCSSARMTLLVVRIFHLLGKINNSMAWALQKYNQRQFSGAKITPVCSGRVPDVIM